MEVPKTNSGGEPRRPARLRTQIAIAVAAYALILISGMVAITGVFAELSMGDLTVLLLIAAAEAGAIAALAGSVLSRRVAEPMEAWAETADDIGRGARRVSFPAARGSAELDRLGGTLQSMFVHLAEREKTLEASVAERTEALQRVVDELKLVTDGVASLIGRFDLEGRILYANRAYDAFFGLGPGGALGKRLVEVAGEDAQATYDSCLPRLRAGESVRLDRETTARGVAVHLDIHLVPHRDALGEVDSAYVLANDITAHKMVERLLAQQALSDALTGLPNKRHFGDRLSQALAHARRREAHGAVLFVDLDDFKPVNDRLGHAAGDALLTQVAARLLGCVRAGDTVARVGGDEFAVLMEDVTSAEETGIIGSRIVSSLRSPFRLDEGEVAISCSIGVALFPDDGGDVAALMRNADRAMYRAKQSGKGRALRWTGSA
jgi:diguanylate cyclase (GGDEF)-like protein/PAS domain S-box-containing protein